MDKRMDEGKEDGWKEVLMIKICKKIIDCKTEYKWLEHTNDKTNEANVLIQENKFQSEGKYPPLGFI